MVVAAHKPIRVMIVDDESMIRRGLRLLVEEHPRLKVIAEASNSREAIERVASEKPDVILLDVNLRGENGLDLMPRLHAECASARVLVLTGATDTETYINAMRLGAMGLLLKEKEPEVLHKAIEKVHRGEVWFDRSLMGKLQAERARPVPVKDSEARKIESLSARQREVVALIGEGLRNKQIGARLFISEGTVRRHLNDIFAKLDMKDRFELMIYAYRHNLAKPPQ
ncbi:MAG: two-component system, NarL family, response regulator DegU [Acidobacteriota bacterium]|nr:two-component system, NarL family, response regulator DegU [Acidobacteriota bacterium]